MLPEGLLVSIDCLARQKDIKIDDGLSHPKEILMFRILLNGHLLAMDHMVSLSRLVDMFKLFLV